MRQAPTAEELFSLTRPEIDCMSRQALKVIESNAPPTARDAANAYATMTACRLELEGRAR